MLSREPAWVLTSRHRRGCERRKTHLQIVPPIVHMVWMVIQTSMSLTDESYAFDTDLNGRHSAHRYTGEAVSSLRGELVREHLQVLIISRNATAKLSWAIRFPHTAIERLAGDKEIPRKHRQPRLTATLDDPIGCAWESFPAATLG